jgi:lauroyl/myristoyl acyltransferase
MVLAYEDALWIIRKLFGSRPVAIYGEDLSGHGVFAQVSAVKDLGGIELVDSSPSAMRRILATLAAGGVFVTYPDFVYSEHKAMSVPFLGLPWPFSRSFISLCARDGTMLLPCYPIRTGSSITVHCERPVHVVVPQGQQADPRWSLPLAGATVARLLERMILRNPTQWALLATAVGHCAQRARV